MRYELSDDEWTAIKPMPPNKPRSVRRVNACSMASFGSSVQVRPGAAFRRTMGPTRPATIGSCAGGKLGSGMIDTPVVRVHQHEACIADNNHQDMDRSRGGLTSKTHAVVDADRPPVRLALTPGEAHDNRLCSALLSALLPQTMLLADRRARARGRC
jgi:transposase